MAQEIARNMLVRFAEETKPHLEAIRAGFRAFCDDSSQAERATETVRLTHRVKGDASMIGLSAFSHVAFFLEEILQQLAEQGESNEHAVWAVGELTSSLERFLDEMLDDSLTARHALVGGLKAYRRYRWYPEDEDQAEIQRLLLSEDQDHGPVRDRSNETAPGESTDDLPLDSAQLDAFREEVAEHLQVVVDLLSADDELDPTDWQQIRRSVHCVKGNAGTIGFQTVADLAHTMEDLLVQLCDGEIEATADVRTLLSHATDVLSDLTDDGGTATNLEDLYHQFAGLLEDTNLEEAGRNQSETDSSSMATVEIGQEAIAALQADLEHTVSPELFGVYREEAEDHIKLLYGGLNDLQTAPQDREKIQDVRRSAHTLKGAAGAVGLRVVTKLSHRMEDLLDRLYDGTSTATPEILTLLLDTTDRLHDLSSGEFDQEELKGGVIQLYAQYSSLLDADKPDTASSPRSEITIDVSSVPTPQPTKDADASTQTSRPAPERQQAGQVLRVPIARIDDLVRTVSELIINRTTFEQRMVDFVRCVDELQPILERLRSVSHEMETRYSVDAMRDHRSLGSGPSSPSTSPRSQIDQSRFTEFDALEFDRYNDFHLISRSVAEATGDVNTVSNELRTLVGDFDSLLGRQERLSRDTQDRLMRIRMVPLATLATRLHRAVRVVATNQNKKVELVIEGEEIELDKTVLEEIADPLLHLLRNAVDHGVEPADLRVVKGKPETAMIRVRAFYQGTQVVVRVSDDGGGLDDERIRSAAVKGGYLSGPEAESMTPQEIYPYIFVPGLSTAGQVSEVSGRGVGMDIVRDKVQKLKGTIGVDSEPGKGTTFTIRLPMTLAVTRALMVAAGNETFAIPMQSVVQIARLERDEVERLGGDPVIRLGGTACPLIRLSQHLGVREVEGVEESPTIPILIVRSGDQQVAVRVDRIVAGRDIVVKTLGTHLRKVNGLVGATLLGDGTVVPILDPNTFSTTAVSTAMPPHGAPQASAAGNNTTSVMIVDDSVSVRRVMENLVESQGWVPIVAKDGVDALEKLQSSNTIPDVFLLDIEMPRMDGYELLSTLRGIARYQDSPVVMVTSRAGDKHREKAFSLGATDYLVKPYQDDQLIALIRKLSTESTLA